MSFTINCAFLNRDLWSKRKCEENRMTNRIASPKKSDDFYSKRL